MASMVLALFLALGSLSAVVRAEVYTALVDMEELLGSESAMISALEGYIAAEQRWLDELRTKYAHFAHEHAMASRDVTRYLSNPLNGFLLVKRLANDWKELETNIEEDSVGKEAVRNMTQLRETLPFPTDEDLTGAAVALMRLQDTYRLETASLADGRLNGVQYSTQLTAGDCFELGRQSYNHQDYYHTVLWMREALERQQAERNNTRVQRWEILEYLAYSTYMRGNVRRAMQLTDELLVLMPGHERALGNLKFYRAAVEQDSAPLNTDGKNEDKEGVEETRPLDELPEREVYELLCRDGARPPPEVTSRLKCQYVDLGRPYLRIAPLKEEEAYPNPRILLYREAIYESEMETFKKMAQPRLRRATVQNFRTGNLETAHYRISKSAWLKDHEAEAVARVSRRVEHITGLTTDTAEEMQVVNYGIGGHYEPHYDFARREEKDAFKSLGTGNRIATVLFYMSDVAAGGATVFPELRISLRPERGTAAVWANLLPNGEGDLRTRHAACPVLAGSKWVSNKWLHERGQEFLRPCPANYIRDHPEPDDQSQETDSGQS